MNYTAAKDFEHAGHAFKAGDPVPGDVFEPDIYPSLVGMGWIVEGEAEPEKPAIAKPTKPVKPAKSTTPKPAKAKKPAKKK
jgi:hypothetical protein